LWALEKAAVAVAMAGEEAKATFSKSSTATESLAPNLATSPLSSLFSKESLSFPVDRERTSLESFSVTEAKLALAATSGLVTLAARGSTSECPLLLLPLLPPWCPRWCLEGE
jgi:hypothetical protein